jgi:hypothetical protein
MSALNRDKSAFDQRMAQKFERRLAAARVLRNAAPRIPDAVPAAADAAEPPVAANASGVKVRL